MAEGIPVHEALSLARKRGIPVSVPVYRAEKRGGELVLYLYGRVEPLVVPVRAARGKGGAVKG